jgi:hypothetical protein
MESGDRRRLAGRERRRLNFDHGAGSSAFFFSPNALTLPDSTWGLTA